jgi:hypothetical protein
MNAFRIFFKVGREFDSNFIYEISFGFMPRQFKNTPEERYMYKEEGDVPEIYFILKGEWGVAFNSYLSENSDRSEIDEDLKGPPDMMRQGFLLGQRKTNCGYIGDYYCFASQRSEFHYVALSTVETYALSKEFMIKNIFSKRPGLHKDMLADAFCRYLRDFRKPTMHKRTEFIKRQNKTLHYSKIMTKNMARPNMCKILAQVQKKRSLFANAPALVKLDLRKEIVERQKRLKDYKDLFETMNEQSITMFEHMKEINKLVDRKTLEIEEEMSKTEGLFVEALNGIVRFMAQSQSEAAKNLN